MKLAVVIPTYNESSNIIRLIKDIHKSIDCLPIVVDDNSPDGTAEQVRAFSDAPVHLIERKGKLGLGSAYMEGFAWALRHNFDAIAQMDADFSHSPFELPAMAELLAEAELVLGSRYVENGRITDWGLWRHTCSRGAISVSRHGLGLSTRDVTSGFRLWRKSLLAKIMCLPVNSSGYAFQEEMLFHAERIGAYVIEHPIVFKDRVEGRSKLSWADAAEFFKVIARLRKDYGTLKKI